MIFSLVFAEQKWWFVLTLRGHLLLEESPLCSVCGPHPSQSLVAACATLCLCSLKSFSLPRHTDVSPCSLKQMMCAVGGKGDEEGGGLAGMDAPRWEKEGRGIVHVRKSSMERVMEENGLWSRASDWEGREESRLWVNVIARRLKVCDLRLFGHHMLLLKHVVGLFIN